MPELENRLVLHRFMCSQFNSPGLREMINAVNQAENRGASGEPPNFYGELNAHRLLIHEQVREYDENIRRIGEQLKMGGGERAWKPFQYLALLFTERYLDLYFTDADDLLKELNQYNKFRFARKRIPPYTADDLRKLAFQSATGSGKTLLLHANLLQYLHYLKKHNRIKKLNKIVLVTPDEGLSNQHLREMRASGIPARLFSDGDYVGGLPGKNTVDIIDLHKIAEQKGVKRVALEAFEGNNLILVDEGHLGAKGNVWRNHRQKLARNGFTFEYSATFNQAVAGSGAGIADLRDEYGKSILFDYSYKFFYDDGYGKNYHITNLREDYDGETNNTYMLGCLLMFYQQCKVFAESGGKLREYNLTPPLWMFLGRTVTGQKTGANNQTKSDVVSIVRFLAWVLNNRGGGVKKEIKRIVRGQSELFDENGVDLFAERLVQIGNSANEIYAGVCAQIFNGRGQLQVAQLTAAGELQLHTTNPDEPFGVINVGDASGLYALLEQAQTAAEGTANDFRIGKNEFVKPQFADVDKRHSPINMVIGARKFVAGWNSWRVSTMGLLHVGTGQGPQIIQMFGRGVRLKGRDMSLKRHDRLELSQTQTDAKLSLLETLNVFGLRANYMEQFKKYLHQQGIHTDRDLFQLPVKTMPRPDGLKIIKRRDDVGEFQYSDECLDLLDKPDAPNAQLHTTLDRRPHLQTETAVARQQSATRPPPREIFTEQHRALMNRQRIYHRIIARKQQSRWHNITITPQAVNELLARDDWYTLLIPAAKMEFANYARVREWEELAVTLICEYAKNLWQHARQQWEQKHIEAVTLTDEHANYIKEYRLSVSKKKTRLIAEIENLARAMENGQYADNFTLDGVQLSLLDAKFHAYIPLLHVDTRLDDERNANEPPGIKVSPTPLNSGEKKFVTDLVEARNDCAEVHNKEIYLMRNLSRGKGVSFFNDYSFYPDFILWLKDSARQDVFFIDPKGIARHSGTIDAKIRVHSLIKEIEKRMHQENHRDLFLHSYIWSTTSYRDTDPQLSTPRRQYNQQGVYFAEDGARGIAEMLRHALTL